MNIGYYSNTNSMLLDANNTAIGKRIVARVDGKNKIAVYKKR